MIIEILHYVQNDIGGVFRRKDLYEIAAPSATARNDSGEGLPRYAYGFARNDELCK